MLLHEPPFAHAAGAPSRMAVDYSSSLIADPSATPASELARLNALLADMDADGVNNLCNGRREGHTCYDGGVAGLKAALFSQLLGFSASGCGLCGPQAEGSKPCSCAAPGNKTRCSCDGKLTGAQYFAPANYGVELARVLVESVGEANTISGTINANFNSTVQLRNSSLVRVCVVCDTHNARVRRVGGKT
jgi:hypothetical protein